QRREARRPAGGSRPAGRLRPGGTATARRGGCGRRGGCRQDAGRWYGWGAGCGEQTGGGAAVVAGTRNSVWRWTSTGRPKGAWAGPVRGSAVEQDAEEQSRQCAEEAERAADRQGGLRSADDVDRHPAPGEG